MMKRIIGLAAFFFLINFSSYGQKPLNPIKDNGPKTKIELLRADSLIGENSITQVQTFLGHVIFKHNGVYLGCNKAIHNVSSNFIEAYGKIVINQGDTLTITGDTLYYDGNTQFAKVYGKQVVLRDKKITLRTQKVHYDIPRSQAYYPVPGYIDTDSSRLSSKIGYYNTRTKIFNYYGDVEIKNPSYLVCTDSLDYDAISKQAIFKTYTSIQSKNGTVAAYKGAYNTKTKVSKLVGRAKVINDEFSLEGDTLNYDNLIDKGNALGNVVFVSFKDTLIALGKKAFRDGSIGKVDLYGDAFCEKLAGTDTLLLTADSLWIFEKKDTVSKTNAPAKENLETIIAKSKVKTFKSDFQSVSDSLFYDFKNGIVHFIKKPILWNFENQLEADTVRIYLKDEKLHKMDMIRDCFVIEKDTIGNYNQIKGRKLFAYFTNNSILKEIQVLGNGESNFYALDEKNKLIGLNKVQCGKMNFSFKDKKVNNIVFKSKPESLLIPPNEITKEDLFLENFEWKIKERPTKEKFTKKRAIPFM